MKSLFWVRNRSGWRGSREGAWYRDCWEIIERASYFFAMDAKYIQNAGRRLLHSPNNGFPQASFTAWSKLTGHGNASIYYRGKWVQSRSEKSQLRNLNSSYYTNADYSPLDYGHTHCAVCGVLFFLPNPRARDQWIKIKCAGLRPACWPCCQREELIKEKNIEVGENRKLINQLKKELSNVRNKKQ
jgi:hypothetical protein